MLFKYMEYVMQDRKEYNYSRMVSAKAQMDSVYQDMMLSIHRGYVNKEMRNRMALFLRNAAADVERIGWL